MKGNLLLIDDEVLLVKSIRLLLESYADKVLTAHDGKEGYEVFKNNVVHCIVCDINMPVMNGVDLIKKIREENSEVPFIFYTGHGNRELMLEAAKYGAFDFLNKPCLDGLEEIVQKALHLGTNQGAAAETDFTSDYAKMLKELEGL